MEFSPTPSGCFEEELTVVTLIQKYPVIVNKRSLLLFFITLQPKAE